MNGPLLRIALAQMNAVVGDIAGNERAIADLSRAAGVRKPRKGAPEAVKV